MYKLVVMDVDDTIVMSGKKISSKVKEAVKKVQQKGIKVTLASGRMYQTMRSVAQELEIKLPLISCNGAMVRDEEKIFSCALLDKKAAKDILYFFERKNKVLQMYTSEGLFTKKKCERTWRLEQGEGLPCRVIEEEAYASFYQNDLLKFLIRLESDEVQQYIDELQEFFGSRISAALSHNFYIEITRQGINKGSALALLAGQLGIDRGAVLAIGDSPNDKKMIEWAGLGIAMGNASVEVKLIADKVTLPIEEDGVAEALYKYILSS